MIVSRACFLQEVTAASDLRRFPAVCSCSAVAGDWLMVALSFLSPLLLFRRGPFARQLWFLVGIPSWLSDACQKATSRHHHYSANIPISRGYCFTMLNASFAMRVSEQVTPIFVQPVEIPAPCHVRLRGPTLKLCESFAVCRTRLSLPYVLRNT